jgi:hypothetical protein
LSTVGTRLVPVGDRLFHWAAVWLKLVA